jgi:lipopolysaccharide export LptBFGC system permease protein LptF
MILARYVFRKWIFAFLATVISLTLFLLLEDMYRNLPNFLGKRMGIFPLLCYYVLLCPRILYSLLPLAVFLSALFALSKLHASNEIVAMEMSGYALWRIFCYFPVAIFAMVCAMVWMQLFAIVRVEEWREEILSRCCKNRFGGNVFSRKAVHVNFENGPAERIWFMEELDLRENCAVGVFIFEYGKEKRKIYCQEAFWLGTHWEFFHGVESQLGEEGIVEQGRVSFGKKVESAFDETPRQMFLQKKRVRDMVWGEIRELNNYENGRSFRSREYCVRYHEICAHCVLPLFAFFYAIPFSISPMKRGGLGSMAHALSYLFLFFMATNGCHLLALRGYFPAIFAPWFPHIFFGSYGIWHWRKRSNF